MWAVRSRSLALAIPPLSSAKPKSFSSVEPSTTPANTPCPTKPSSSTRIRAVGFVCVRRGRRQHRERRTRRQQWTRCRCCSTAVPPEVTSTLLVGGSFAPDDLRLLDLQQGEDQAQWVKVPVAGKTPGKRYGHSMTLCKPYLYLFGGNTGTVPANDLWCVNVEEPFTWAKVQCSSECPPVRVYHSAAECLSGSAARMLMIFGGRTVDQSTLNDTWGLRRNSDGTCDWVKAPYRPDRVKPLGRFQHSSVFIDNYMAIIGGRANSTESIVLFNVYDTETAEWFSFNSIKRFRHASWLVDGVIYVFGGFQQGLRDVPTDTILHLDYASLIKNMKKNSGEDAKQEVKAKVDVKEEKKPVDDPGIVAEIKPVLEKKETKQEVVDTEEVKKVTAAVLKQENKDFKLSSQAHVALSFNARSKNLTNHVQQVPVTKLNDEAKKLGASPIIPTAEPQKSINEPLSTLFINGLLNQGLSFSTSFQFSKDNVVQLAREFKAVLELQPTVVNIKAPLKIFGSLYGNFNDLMKLFGLWKPPIEASLGGDIDSTAYLFLGNYVDRAKKSLETICLLMALKLQFPDSIYLLRGSHENVAINRVYGFGEECAVRLQEDTSKPSSVFQSVNRAFEWLPLAAVVENKILCVHGGIGPSVGKLDDIGRVKRPVNLGDGNGVLVQCVWSDPAKSEAESGFVKNTSRKEISADNIFRFGSDVLNKFLEKNELEMIIRSREIAPDLSLIHICRCRRYAVCRSRWSPYH
eukprot:TRINITY_DN6896_c0_g1_i26.p1 TRINITY_DN6896_c0_g1~~TRINITY_DN6896_c0_g1_i26.p1  ORF type:complete len:746 (-),score=105.30 TRINITY_DN6896_c0_g1_i26:17-2254(-)